MTERACDWCEGAGGDLVRRTSLSDDRPVWVHLDCLDMWEDAQVKLAGLTLDELLAVRDWNDSR